MSAKVRYEPVHLTLSVPEGDVLLAWATAAHKQQAASVVFGNADGGSAVETLVLAAAYCVGYREEFVSGETQDGAYVCHLVLTDPAGFTLQAGGPASAFVAPAAGNHGVPGTGTDFLERETFNKKPIAFATPTSFAALVEPSEGLAAVLASCLTIKQPHMLDPEMDPNLFRNQVISDLEKIYATPTGKEMLESLAKSGKNISIQHSMKGNAIGGYTKEKARFLQDNGEMGAGTDSKIGYNPSINSLGSENDWETRPPAIGLAHELIHAEQAAYGRMVDGKAPNGPRLKHPDSMAEKEADIRELEAVGVPPYDSYPFSENKIRAQWNPAQPERKWY